MGTLYPGNYGHKNCCSEDRGVDSRASGTECVLVLELWTLLMYLGVLHKAIHTHESQFITLYATIRLQFISGVIQDKIYTNTRPKDRQKLNFRYFEIFSHVTLAIKMLQPIIYTMYIY